MMITDKQKRDIHHSSPDDALGHFESPLGIINIIADSTRIKAISFANEDTDRVCSKDHVNGETMPASDLIVECCNQLGRYFDGNLRVFSFPFEQRGTSFQQSVWQQLLKVTYGETLSYLALAKRLGDHKVIRAAAAANGRNNLAIVIPCHRIIGTSGDLVGYAGGLWRKKWLLEHEMKHARGLQTLF